jgi:hypothetical protein
VGSRRKEQTAEAKPAPDPHFEIQYSAVNTLGVGVAIGIGVGL